MITDPFGRPVNSIRISVTRRCNLNCIYCHREGETWEGGVEITPEEIAETVRIGTDFGVNLVKLTGGEPLLRKDILEIIRRISQIPEIQEISMTTNATLLGDLASDLKRAGLDRVNVSIDSLRPETYARITRADGLEEVKEGISRSLDVGLIPVKANTVLLRGLNQEEVPSMIDFSSRNGLILQIIELEGLFKGDKIYEMYHCDVKPLEEELGRRAKKVVVRKLHRRRRYFLDGDAVVEIVRPMHNSDFCMNCTRMRVTSDGKLKPCLMRNDNLVDILTPMRSGASREELNSLFKKAISHREPYFR